MKKTKLLTSLAAFVLVLGLGACNQPDEEETTSEEGGEVTTTDTGSSSEGETPSEPVAYAIVGDFDDTDGWDNAPSSESKYYIPAGTTNYEVTVTIEDEPDDCTWAAGLRVVNYDTWDLALGFDDLAEGSEETLYGDGEKNIKVEWGETYDLVLELGDTKSILVTVHEEGGNEGEGDTIPGTSYVIGESYWLGYNMSNVDYYFDGTVYNTNYGGVTDDTSKAVWVTIDEYGDGYSLGFVSDDEKTQYIYMAESGDSRYFKWRDEPFAWSYDETYDTFVAYDSENTLYFIGTYGTYKDLCCNAYGYLTGEKDTSNAQYPAHLYEIKAPTALYISGADTLSVELSTQLTVTANAGEYAGATWSSSNDEYATVDETGLVTAVAEGEVTIYATSILDPNIVGSHTMTIEAKAEGSRTLEYTYTFTGNEGITTSGGSKVLNGLTWTTTSAAYIGFDSSSGRGLQIGSSNNPQTTPWTISTDFGEDVTLTSVGINVVGASSSSGANFTITHGETAVASAVSFSTTAQDYEYTNLSISGSTLSISMVCTARAMYLKYISFTIEVGPDSTLNW